MRLIRSFHWNKCPLRFIHRQCNSLSKSQNFTSILLPSNQSLLLNLLDWYEIVSLIIRTLSVSSLPSSLFLLLHWKANKQGSPLFMLNSKLFHWIKASKQKRITVQVPRSSNLDSLDYGLIFDFFWTELEEDIDIEGGDGFDFILTELDRTRRREGLFEVHFSYINRTTSRHILLYHIA